MGSLRGQVMSQDSSTSQAIPDWRSKGKNELLSNSKAVLTPRPLAVSPVVKTLFPVTETKARPDWNTTSEAENVLLRVNIPQKLNQINHADAAKTALAKFGTTPEKLAEGRDIISRDDAEWKAPLKSIQSKSVMSSKETICPTN